MSNYTTSTTNFSDGTVGDANSGAYAQAKEGQTQSLIMGATAATLGQRYLSRCGSRNPTACYLGAAAMTAAGLAAVKAMESQGLMNGLGGDGSGQGTQDTSNTATSALTQQLNKLKADLTAQGFSVDENGNITNSSGKTVNGDLSPQSLADAGVSASDAGQIQAGLAEMRKQLKEQTGANSAALVGQTTSSSGFGRVSISSLDDGQKETTAATEAERTGIDRDPAAWSGFFKKFGDGVIGVAQSDLFLMVEKRVEHERNGMGN
jgi:hypothetical protein